jgi:hypothetical protein
MDKQPKKYQWFRLYTEILEDRKLKRFTHAQKWGWIVVMCLASEKLKGERGWFKMADLDIADAMDFSLEDWQSLKRMLLTREMIEVEDGGIIKICNWFTRQYESDHSSERVKKFREKQKTEIQLLNEQCNVSETPPKRNVTAPEYRVQIQSTDTDSTSMNNGTYVHQQADAPKRPASPKPEDDSFRDLKRLANSDEKSQEFRAAREMVYRRMRELKPERPEKEHGEQSLLWLLHYTANGWKVGRNPMKDWKKAVSTWLNNPNYGANTQPKRGNEPAGADPKRKSVAGEVAEFFARQRESSIKPANN